MLNQTAAVSMFSIALVLLGRICFWDRGTGLGRVLWHKGLLVVVVGGELFLGC